MKTLTTPWDEGVLRAVADAGFFKPRLPKRDTDERRRLGKGPPPPEGMQRMLHTGENGNTDQAPRTSGDGAGEAQAAHWLASTCRESVNESSVN